MKKLFAGIILLALFFFTPTGVWADTLGVCPDGTTNITCKAANLNISQALGSIINFIFVIAVILALGFLIYGGIRWITSGGDKAAVATARGTIIAAIIGLILVVLSYFIINLVLRFLTGSDISGIRIPRLLGGSQDTRPYCGMNQPVDSSCYCFGSIAQSDGSLICRTPDVPIDQR